MKVLLYFRNPENYIELKIHENVDNIKHRKSDGLLTIETDKRVFDYSFKYTLKIEIFS